MNWYKIEFNDVFMNGLTTLQVGCVVKYKCLLQQLNVEKLNEQQLKMNFSWKERQFLVKHFSILGQSKDSSRTILGQSKDKVGNFLDNENKDLACARIYNNINNTYNKEREEKKEKKKINKKVFSKEFEKWWDEVPRKVSKDDAFRKFNTILAGNIATFDELMDGIKRYTEHCKSTKTEERFIKHPSTWLNQGCWKDEYNPSDDDDDNPWKVEWHETNGFREY